MRNRPCCEGNACGNCEDLSYIPWEGQTLCANCFAIEIANFAENHPFLLANMLGLPIIHVPED